MILILIILLILFLLLLFLFLLFFVKLIRLLLFQTVGRAQGQQMALGINAYAFVECSVELNINVDAVFHMVAKGVLEFKLKV